MSHLVAKSQQRGEEAGIMGYQEMPQEASSQLLKLATCWNSSEDLSWLCYSQRLQMLLILLVEGAGDGPWRRRATEAGRSRSMLE